MSRLRFTKDKDHYQPRVDWVKPTFADMLKRQKLNSAPTRFTQANPSSGSQTAYCIDLWINMIMC